MRWARCIAAVAGFVVLVVNGVSAAPPATGASGGDGQFHVVGKRVIGPDGAPVVLRGVNKGGLEYSARGYDNTLANFERMKSWGVNAVRLPLSDNFAVPGMCGWNSGYLATVDRLVAFATKLKMLLILDNHYSTRGVPCGLGDWSGNHEAPDLFNLAFVAQLAQRYRDQPYVAIDLYNEPHDISWDTWRNGGVVGTYAAVGMQTLLDTVRAVGFTGLVFATGIQWGNNLRQIKNRPLARDTDVVYAAHAYPFQCSGVEVPVTVPYECHGRQYPPFLDAQIAPVIANRPVVLTEFGTHRAIPGENAAMLQWAQDHGIGWIAWLWCNGKVSDFCLLNPDATPSVIGRPVHDALALAP